MVSNLPFKLIPEPEQTAQDWWTGRDASPGLWPLDPARRQVWEKRFAERKSSNSSDAPGVAASVASVTEHKAPTQPASVRSSVPPVNEPVSQSATRAEPPAPIKTAVAPSELEATEKVEQPSQAEKKEVVEPKAATAQEAPVPTPVVAPVFAESEERPPTLPAEVPANPEPAQAPATARPSSNTPAEIKSASTSDTPFNPTWSRKFLGAKAALIPSYDQLPPLSSLHPDSLLLQTSVNHLFFPISGPGGRLAVHPRKAKGRMPVGGRGYLSGGVEMAAFSVDPFGDRVAVAGEDGAVRVWLLSTEGFEGVGPEADSVLKGGFVFSFTDVQVTVSIASLRSPFTLLQRTCWSLLPTTSAKLTFDSGTWQLRKSSWLCLLMCKE